MDRIGKAVFLIEHVKMENKLEILKNLYECIFVKIFLYGQRCGH